MHLSGKEDEKNKEEEEDKEALAARERRSSLRSYNGERQVSIRMYVYMNVLLSYLLTP